MINHNLLATTSWKKYLLPRNQRVKNFLEMRGSDVFWQVAQNIHEAYRDGKPELVIMIHPNLSHAISIPKSEYVEVLNEALKFFTKNENYERCSLIKKIRTDIVEKRKIDKTLRLVNVSQN